jgi:hypothetical protein
LTAALAGASFTSLATVSAPASDEGVMEHEPKGTIEENGLDVELTGVHSSRPRRFDLLVGIACLLVAAAIFKPWQSDTQRQPVPPSALASPVISPAPSSASGLTALADQSLVVSASCPDGSRTWAVVPAPDIAGGRIGAVSPGLACRDGNVPRDFTWAIAIAGNPAAPTVVAAP